MEDHRVPPQNIDAERAVLGSMLLEGENKVSIPLAFKTLTANSFYMDAHRCIFKGIAALFEAGESVDLITLTAQLESDGTLEKARGVPYLDEVIESCPTAANVEHYADLVVKEAIRRDMIRTSTSINARAYESTEDVTDVLLDAQSAFLNISHGSEDGVVPVKDAANAMFKDLQVIYNSKEHLLGLPTGFSQLDEMTSGLQPGDYVILAGRPSMGKSVFVQNIIQHVCFENQVPTYLASLEMAAAAVTLRFVCSEASVDMQSIRTGHFYESDWPKLTMAVSKVAQAPLLIDESVKMTPTELRSKVLLATSSMPIGLVVVDYMQLMVSHQSRITRNEEVQNISRSLKALAREISCPLIAVSQLNRATENRPDNRPKLSDLRESGAIEQDGDHVWMLYREDYYDKDTVNKSAELIVRKQRNGPTGTVELGFDPAKVRFQNIGGDNGGTEQPQFYG